MYNVVNKSIIVAATCFTLLSACGGSSSKNEANSLVASADSAIKAGDYTYAIELLDTLQSRYPSELDARRKGLALRPAAIEGITINELQLTDSLQAFYSYEQDSLMQYFTFVNNPELVEGYYVIKELAQSTLFSRTGIEARVSPDGEFYVISSLTAKPVKHTSVTLKDASGSASTAAVAYDGDRNYRSGGTEMITFLGAECDTLGRFLSNSSDKNVTITFNGDSNYTCRLEANDGKSVALAYRMADAIASVKKLAAKKEFLDRQLMLARDQKARSAKD